MGTYLCILKNYISYPISKDVTAVHAEVIKVSKARIKHFAHISATRIISNIQNPGII